MSENLWLALEIGNSRLHWALFRGEKLSKTWDSDYLPIAVIDQLAQYQSLEDFLLKIFPSSPPSPPSPSSPPPPLLLSSVVPSQTEIWQTYYQVRVITLDQVPLKGIYPTLGIDRALSLYGAGSTLGFPMLVIDAGTALTFTGADKHQNLVGGAILPGFHLQLASLTQKTAQLPFVETRNTKSLPQRFALNTEEAMQSGVIYTLLAGIKDFVEAWWCNFPDSKVAIKGGDRTLVVNYMKSQYPEIAARLIVEPNLIFWGMRSLFFL
ncbi:pantothenate kinase [Scytonema hofmannii FACHB-248]|uniref:Type III pantothenate kinase n=1 Tax=Scytonema hofmannii FACHB-248 TaxID=1842502 RepID=A0ABR8H323_9CYAN|nr:MULTISPECIES: pantothenate kinase [Nostocales]MBD2609433.1 pantothenate kinase [Scytonema hofmannii FACHB-248]